jgi:hypothetical protein
VALPRRNSPRLRCAAAEPLERRVLLSFVPAGDEFLVHKDDGADQRTGESGHAVAGDARGNFVVAWEELLDHSLWARRFDAAGTPLGSQFSVTAYGGDPAVSMNASGDFVVTWLGSENQIYARRYDFGGGPQGGAFRVNVSDLFFLDSPKVALDDAGGFAVTWARNNSVVGPDRDVYARRYGPLGQPLTAPFVVNTNVAGDQHAPDIATDAEGNFVVAWVQPATPGPQGVFAQRFDAACARLGDEFRVNSPGLTSDYFSVSMDADGDFAAEFFHQSADGTRGRAVRLFDRTGAPRGEPLVYLVTPHADAVLDMNATGEFVVLYSPQDLGIDPLYGRAFDATGAPQGEEFAVTSVTEGTPNELSGVALSDSGTLAAAWLNRQDDNSDLDVFARVFTSDAPVPATVAARHVFYNHSAFDGNDAAANAADDGAIATDKQALRPGQTATFSNVTSYSRGINGVMIDVANLPAGAAPTAGDFSFRSGRGAATFSDGPSNVQVSVRRGAGMNGSDRVTLTWPDYNPASASPLAQAVANAWLEVTVKANGNTGLAAPDVFGFGNLIGETGNAPSALAVDTSDLLAVRRKLFTFAPVTSRFDFVRDGRVTASDFSIVRANFLRRLTLTTVATSLPGAPVFIDRFETGRVADGVLG